MDASQDAAEIPLVVRQVFDGGGGFGDAGLEEHIQVQPARDDDPEQEVRDRAEVVERIVRFAERVVEHGLDAQEQPLSRALHEPQHRNRLCAQASTKSERHHAIPLCRVGRRCRRHSRSR